MTSLEQAPVGVVVLDEFYLTKKWPVQELRRLMELLTSGKVCVVPVMYDMTFEQVGEVMERLSKADSTASGGASRNDAAMLAKLERITMVHSNTADMVRDHARHCCVPMPDVGHRRARWWTAVQLRSLRPGNRLGCGSTVDEQTAMMQCRAQNAFLDTISFAVLRQLVGACKKFQTQTCREHETIFVSNVRNAVSYICEEKHFQSLSRRDVSEAKEWLEDLSFLYRNMQKVRTSVHCCVPLKPAVVCSVVPVTAALL